MFKRLLLTIMLLLPAPILANGISGGGIGVGVPGVPGSIDCPIPSAAITPNIDAHRTTGVAPLAVNFIGYGTVSGSGHETLRTIVYDWDFGDPSSGTFFTDGTSQNESRGPVVAHIFYQPGTYTVEMVATDPDGECNFETVSIEVTDPDTVFSGTNTVCVSTSGTFTDCPAGATQTTSSDFDATMQTAAGKRTLYRRGETFTMSAGKTVSSSVGSVGVFGAGSSRAIVNLTGGSGISFNAATPAADWRVGDLEFIGASVNPGMDVFAKTNAGQLQNLTFYRNDCDSDCQLIGLGNQLHHGIAIFENDSRGVTGGVGENIVFVKSERLMIVGNHFEDSTAAEHIIRVTRALDAVISNNYLADQATGRIVLKFHGDNGIGGESEYWNVYHNEFLGATGGAPTVDIGPQNGNEDERVRRGVFDSNYILNTDANIAAVRFATEGEVTARNNVCRMINDNSCFVVQKNGGQPSGVTQADHQFYNNTCVSYASQVSPVCIAMGGSAPRIAVNTLLVSDAGGGADAVTGTVDTETNSILLTEASAPFVVDPPVAWADYEFDLGGSADQNGVDADGVIYDWEGTVRPSPPNIGHDEP